MTTSAFFGSRPQSANCRSQLMSEPGSAGVEHPALLIAANRQLPRASPMTFRSQPLGCDDPALGSAGRMALIRVRKPQTERNRVRETRGPIAASGLRCLTFGTCSYFGITGCQLQVTHVTSCRYCVTTGPSDGLRRAEGALLLRAGAAANWRTPCGSKGPAQIRNANGGACGEL